VDAEESERLAAEVAQHLRLPPERGPAATYREPATQGLDGEWLGAFGQVLFGALSRSAFRVTFNGKEGRSADRHGEATLRVVAWDGAYVELLKTYDRTGIAFRYRGEVRGATLTGYWEAPTTSAKGLFYLRRRERYEEAHVQRMTRDARPQRALLSFLPVFLFVAVAVAAERYTGDFRLALVALLVPGLLVVLGRRYGADARLIARVRGAVEDLQRQSLAAPEDAPADAPPVPSREGATAPRVRVAHPADAVRREDVAPESEEGAEDAAPEQRRRPE
jgi:hypothetical protein